MTFGVNHSYYSHGISFSSGVFKAQKDLLPRLLAYDLNHAIFHALIVSFTRLICQIYLAMALAVTVAHCASGQCL